MKNEKILNAMEKISDELIENAAITTGKKGHTVVWVRWAAMVACLCLVVSIAIPFLHRKTNPGKQDFFSPGSYDSISPGSHDYVQKSLRSSACRPRLLLMWQVNTFPI